MAMLQQFSNETIQVPLAKDHEVVEAFLAKRLDEPLDEGVGVGRAVSGPLNSHAIVASNDRANFVSRSYRITAAPSLDFWRA